MEEEEGFGWNEELKKELDGMEAAGVIEKVEEPTE